MPLSKISGEDVVEPVAASLSGASVQPPTNVVYDHGATRDHTNMYIVGEGAIRSVGNEYDGKISTVVPEEANMVPKKGNYPFSGIALVVPEVEQKECGDRVPGMIWKHNRVNWAGDLA